MATPTICVSAARRCLRCAKRLDQHTRPEQRTSFRATPQRFWQSFYPASAYSTDVDFRRQQQQSGHTQPSEKQASGRRNSDDLSGLLPVLATFFGAFAATVGINYLYNNDPGPSRLLPDKYNSFRLIEARQRSSLLDRSAASQLPTALSTSNTDLGRTSPVQGGDHVHLAIEPPSYIAPPKMKKEQVDALVAAGSSPGNVWRITSLWMKEPALQIERPYTPLYADAIAYPRGHGRPIDLLIKKYPDGELGRYAHKLHANQTVELRGPEVTWQGSKKDELVMIVGGTGITPAFQLATSILGRPDDELHMLQAAVASPIVPRVSIVYAAPHPSAFLLLPELARLKAQYGNRLHIQLVAESIDADDKRRPSRLERADSSWSDWLLRRRAHYTLQNLPVEVGSINDGIVRRALDKVTPAQKRQGGAGANGASSPTPSRQILVCGPDGMIAHVAGPRRPQSQGPLAGILGRLQVPEKHVWKL